MMFSTSLAAMAVSGLMATANLIQPTWVTDYSKALKISAEQSKLVSNQVLVQAAVSAVSQANQIPQSLLRVLQ